jgi:hypothetical protein
MRANDVHRLRLNKQLIALGLIYLLESHAARLINLPLYIAGGLLRHRLSDLRLIVASEIGWMGSNGKFHEVREE